MPPDPNHAPSVLTGIVQAVNARGLKLGGRWFNYSRFSPVARPEVGQTVRLELDGTFIRVLEHDPETGAVPAQDPDTQEATGPSRERVITRLACLKAAAAFLAPRLTSEEGELVVLAEVLEDWVLRAP